MPAARAANGHAAAAPQVLGACAVTPYLKAPASLGPGNSWLVFEKELDDALDVSAKAGDEVRACLDKNKIRIFGADASILPALAQIVSTSETPSRDGDGACNEVLSVRSQCGQISLSYECRSACRNCPDQVERLRQCSDHE